MLTNQDEPEVLETPGTEVEQDTATDVVDEETQSDTEDIEALKARADELEKKNKQLFERLKKKEERPTDDISTRDVLYLAKADIPPEDIDEVVTYAKKMGVSLQDAHNHFKPILKERLEERRSAQATQTRSPRGTHKVDGNDLLSRAERANEMPDSDEGMQSIFAARLARRFNK